MRQTSGHPAVLAGLLGVAEWSVPTVVVALPLDEAVDAVSHSLLLQFVVGCAAGAAVAGVISVIADHLSRNHGDVAPKAAEDEQLDDQRWASSSLNLMRAQALEDDDDPTGDLGRFRTGRLTIDLPVQEAKEAPAKARRGRHAAHAARSRAERSRATAAGRHFAGAVKAPQVPTLTAIGPAKGRHFAAAVEARQADLARLRQADTKRRGAHFKTAQHEAPVADAPKAALVAEKQVAAPQAVAESVPSIESARARLARLPLIEPASAVQPAPVIARSADPTPASDEAPAEDLSAATTHRLTLRERMKTVREVLADRLSPDAMESIPVITRADGSVGDVRPSWFDQTLAPVLASITGITGKLDDTAAKAATQAMTGEEAPVVEQAAQPSRASYISRRVAEVNVGMFPERRSADELEHEDMWEQALAAMGETIRQETPIFQDVVGGPATIDDPDGLEGPTGFIPFRVPAGQPEVVDTETYVDYLLRDEFSQNESQIIRRSSRNYLRVIEGGTSPIRARRRTGETGALSTGRHFAPTRFAAEA